MAMLIQYLSAKARHRHRQEPAELCRDAFPPPVTSGLWLQAELVAIATDLAEVLGGGARRCSCSSGCPCCPPEA